MRSRLLAFAASAALFAAPAFAAPVYVPGQGGTVGPNVACTTSDGTTIRCVQPSVTLNDATGAAVGTSGNPLVTSTGAGTAIVGKVGIDQTTPGTTDSVSQKVQAPSASYVAQQGDGLGKAINTPFADAASTWSDVRTGVSAATFTVKAASGASVRNYVTGIQICGVAATVATRVSIKDGTTVMADFEVPAGASCQQTSFSTPLRGTANTATNVTTNAAGPVTFNTQGFTAAN